MTITSSWGPATVRTNRTCYNFSHLENPMCFDSKVTLNKEWYKANQRISYNSPRVKGKLQLRSNPHKYQELEIRAYPGSYSESQDYGAFSVDRMIHTSCRGDWSNPWENGVPSSSPANIKANNRFYSSVRKQSVNLAVAYAERKQTVNLITKSLRKISKSMHYVRRGKMDAAARVLGVRPRDIFHSKKASQRWLELQYGWRPLISDIYKAMEYTVPKPISFTFKVSGVYYGTRTHYNVYLDKIEAKVKERVTIDGKVNVIDPTIVTMNDLGLLNPALVVWEKIPYSFVADWAFPIGKWLENQTALLGLQFEAISETKTQRATWRCYGPTRSDSLTVKVHSDSPWYYKGRSVRKDRTVGVVPPPVLPHFKNPVSVTHALNALALVRVNQKRL